MFNQIFSQSLGLFCGGGWFDVCLWLAGVIGILIPIIVFYIIFRFLTKKFLGHLKFKRITIIILAIIAVFLLSFILRVLDI